MGSEPDFLVAGTLGGGSGQRGWADDLDRMTFIPAESCVSKTLEAHTPRYDSETESLIAHTLRAEGADASEDGTGRGTPLVARQDMTVRRLTPRECERLQGLPDDWTRWDAGGQTLSDSARYRLIGNAVAVPVVRWILSRMAHIEREEASA
jgi:DNA (cytosine-5)-methyltransferase 1